MATTLTTLKPLNLNTTDSYTFGNATVTGNIAVGNVKTDHLLYANGSAWTFSSYSNTDVAAYLPTYTGNISGNFFIGNGSTLTHITGGNVDGQVGNALVAGTVYTNAQPNITSVGTLSSVTVTGLTTATGGVKTANILDTSGTITLQTKYNSTSGDVGVVGNLVVGTSGTGNITATYLIGNGSQLTGLPASYANSNVANYLPTYTGNLSPSNLAVGASANLGAVGNVIITGGSSGQVLSTNGSGTLSWTDQTGGGGGPTIPVAGVQVFTADGSSNTYTLSVTPDDENQITVNIDGVLQLHSSFSLSGNVVTLSGTPVTGSQVEITNISANAGATTGKAIAMAIVFGF